VQCAILRALEAASAWAVDPTTRAPLITFQSLSTPAPSLRVCESIHHPLLVQLFESGHQRWTALGADRDLYFSTEGRLHPEAWQLLIPSQVAPRDELQRPGESLHGQVRHGAHSGMGRHSSLCHLRLQQQCAATRIHVYSLVRVCLRACTHVD
jgi:hypothetical protein